MIGRLLGHANHQSTARYAHLDDEHLVDAAQQVGDAIERLMGGIEVSRRLDLLYRISTYQLGAYDAKANLCPHICTVGSLWRSPVGVEVCLSRQPRSGDRLQSAVRR